MIGTNELLRKLEDISMEEIEEKMKEADQRDEFEIFLICRELKKVLAKTPRSYTEWIEWSFFFQLYLSALRTWLEAYDKEEEIWQK